nr:squalene synthase [Tanacetum cinerariifolium]
MVTDALVHTEDCLKYMSDLRDPEIFKFCAIPQIMAIGTLTLCYNNIEVFRGVVKLRRGLTAKIIDRTNTMADVYGAFYDFSLWLRSKVNLKDPNAHTTITRLEATQKICRASGTLNKRNSYITSDEPSYGPLLIAVLVVILAILYAYLSSNKPKLPFLSTLNFLKFPENSFEVLKRLESSVELLKILENKLESMKILENKLESLKLQENQPVDGLVPLFIKNIHIRKCFGEAVKETTSPDPQGHVKASYDTINTIIKVWSVGGYDGKSVFDLLVVMRIIYAFMRIIAKRKIKKEIMHRRLRHFLCFLFMVALTMISSGESIDFLQSQPEFGSGSGSGPCGMMRTAARMRRMPIVRRCYIWWGISPGKESSSSFSLQPIPGDKSPGIHEELRYSRVPVADPDLLPDTHCWRGQAGGHLPGVGMVLSGQGTYVLSPPPPPPRCTHNSDVFKLKKSNKLLTKQVNMIMKLFRSDDKMSQMLTQLQSQPEFGSGSGSGPCGMMSRALMRTAARMRRMPIMNIDLNADNAMFVNRKPIL